jgi:hypothetical protein
MGAKSPSADVANLVFATLIRAVAKSLVVSEEIYLRESNPQANSTIP